MAKMIKCNVCGKEIKGGLFGNSLFLEFDFLKLECCEDCYRKYKRFVDSEIKCFLNKKINNRFYAHGKTTPESVVRLIDETKQRIDEIRANHKEICFDRHIGNFAINDEGYFFIEEYQSDKEKEVDEHYKRLCQPLVFEYCNENDLIFTKDDISMIRYKQTGISERCGAEGEYSTTFQLILNDPSILSVKPTVVETTVVATGVPSRFKTKQYLEEALLAQMNELMSALNINLPVINEKNYKGGR